jgi:hypothetical protein
MQEYSKRPYITKIRKLGFGRYICQIFSWDVFQTKALVVHVEQVACTQRNSLSCIQKYVFRIENTIVKVTVMQIFYGCSYLLEDI